VDRFVVALQESLNQCPRFDLNIPGLAASAQYLDEAIDSGAEIIYGRWDSHTRWGPLVIRGISMSSPIFCTGEMAPIAGVNAFSDLEDLFLQYAQVSMRLGASIFGDRRSARHLANQIDAGCICINDLLAPTAHPAVCLAPREESGYGATRGPEGLLEMTSPVTIANRTGHFLPHLSRVNVEKPVPLRNILALKHSPHLRTRLNSLLRVIQGR
jgi:aldehyde dehydrogenase (NAD+)